MKYIETVLTPALIPYYDFKDRLVIVIDIFRASTTICNALNNGANYIAPVPTLQACRDYQDKNLIRAAERDGAPLSEFQLSNSPLDFSPEKVKGKNIVLSTTNGTKAIEKLKNCKQLIIASFLNIDSICRYIEKNNSSILIVCSGSRNKFKIEDALCAGYIVKSCSKSFDYLCESCVAVKELYTNKQNNMIDLVYTSSHSQRYISLNLQEDVKFSLQLNLFDLVPYLDKGKIVPM